MLPFKNSPSPESLNSTTTSRKSDHLEICIQKNVESQVSAGWDEIILPYRSLPEISFDAISLKTEFLKFNFDYPFLISSMTGGTPEADNLNLILAEFATEYNIPMGLGSMRFLLEKKSTSPNAINNLRKKSPRAHLWANIGAVQLNYGVTPSDCQWLVDQLEAQALIVHLNPLQEAIQAEGDRNFSGLWKKLDGLRKQIKTPLILKETGCGLDPVTAKRAVETGFDALDTAGLGGTHWGFIEGLRSSDREALGLTFRNFGIPSAECLRQVRKAVGPDFPVIASGGLRSGIDCAKAFLLGANFCGLALPFLKAAKKGPENLRQEMSILIESLRIACFVTGSPLPKELNAV
jgi:isopentenyl-diphosphate delta-isomerase